jgi:muconolactone delta-isomerase
MPLRVWRTDEVTPLSPHPNDPPPEARTPERPGAGAGPDHAVEFLTTFTLTIPGGPPDQALEDAEAAEADRARELAAQGYLERLWRLPGEGRALGLWRARDNAGMHAILESLPLGPWLGVRTTRLTPHPSDSSTSVMPRNRLATWSSCPVAASCAQSIAETIPPAYRPARLAFGAWVISRAALSDSATAPP